MKRKWIIFNVFMYNFEETASLVMVLTVSDSLFKILQLGIVKLNFFVETE